MPGLGGAMFGIRNAYFIYIVAAAVVAIGAGVVLKDGLPELPGLPDFVPGEKLVCEEGNTTCEDEVYYSCINNTWVDQGRCPGLPPIIDIQDVYKNGTELEARKYRVEGEVKSVGDGRIEVQDDTGKIWIKCSTDECFTFREGEKVKLDVLTSFDKVFNVTYTVSDEVIYQIPSRPINIDIFPISLEGSITSNLCDTLPDINPNIRIENGIAPTAGSSFVLSYVGYTDSIKSYENMRDGICKVDGANFFSEFKGENRQPVWCGKFLGGEFCFVTYDYAVDEEDWTTDAPYAEVKTICDEYGGLISSNVVGQSSGLNLIAYKPPFCSIKIFPEGQDLETKERCIARGGEVIDTTCKIVDQEDIERCQDAGGVVTAERCFDKTYCDVNDYAFRDTSGFPICVDEKGLRLTGIFSDIKDGCLIGDIRVCSVNYEIIDILIQNFELAEA